MPEGPHRHPSGRPPAPRKPQLASVMLFSRRLSAALTANSHISHSGVASWGRRIKENKRK